MNKKQGYKNHFLKGYFIGVAFCGTVSILLLIALWLFM